MELTDRVVRIVHVPGAGLLASDVTGRLHLLDEERLHLLRSSPAQPGGLLPGHSPIYTLQAADGWVVGRDKRGTIMRWRLDTLDLVDALNADHVCDRSSLMPQEEPSPQISRGMHIHQGKVYVNNGYRQIVVLDLATFAVERIAPSLPGDIAMEWVCTDHPDLDAVSDKGGRVFLGSLAELDFPVEAKIDGGNVHRIVYDPLHHRFWATQDDGTDEFDRVANGVVVLDANGQVQQELVLASDDIEFLAFSPDHRHVYVGGFDGVLHILDNTPELRAGRTVEGFSHQLTDFTVGSDGTFYTLTQDGDLRRLSADGSTTLARAAFRPQCVWDIQPSVDDPAESYVATDDGVAVVTVEADPTGLPRVALRDHHRTSDGFTRRVGPLPGGAAGIRRDRWVWRRNRDGSWRWRVRLDALIHTVAGSPDHGRLLVCANDGAHVLDAADGTELERLDLGEAAAWAGCYLPGGERVVAGGNGLVTVFAPDRPDVLWTVDRGEYPKRAWTDGTTLFVSGGDGVVEIDLAGRKITARWHELLDNTVENAVVTADTVAAVSYGVQLAVYDRRSGEIQQLDELLPDFPKGLAAVPLGDGHVLLVGGRGGYLTAYRVAGPGLAPPYTRIRDLFLPRPGLSRPGTEDTV
jgi:WD40 repeat protein